MALHVLAIVSLVAAGAGGACAYRYESLYDDNTTYITCNHDRMSNLDVSKVIVHFYDSSNNFIDNFSIEESVDVIMKYNKFDNGKPMVVYIPGIHSNIDTFISDPIPGSLIKEKDLYFILIDYTPYCPTKLSPKSYEKILPYAYYIGKGIAELLIGLHNIGYSSIHVIGHSFGGQIAGFVGQVYKENAGEGISKITSIDPIRTCFHDAPRRFQIGAGKADYVEVFHCSSLGIEAAVGDVDFILNKELKVQPGCQKSKLKKLNKSVTVKQCGHAVCALFYAQTIANPQLYEACNDYIEYLKGNCTGVALAGYNNPGNVYGKYYASTVTKSGKWKNEDDDVVAGKGL